MEESIDLLCLENSNTCFDDFESNAVDGSASWDHKNLNFNNQFLSNDNLGFEPFVGFLVLSDEAVRFLVEREREHLPRADYLNKLRGGDLDLSVRSEAVDWIWKAHAHFGFGPSSLCLSVNYLDRFLSVHELGRDNGWGAQLLAVACLSIAAKMEESKVPQSVDLQVGEPKILFDARSIQRMELMVLSELRWKMQALTPCSFMDYFLRKITSEQHPAESSISISLELIRNLIKCVDFLEFRPSEIAAAVAIFVLMGSQAIEVDDALARFAIVEKERILKCLELIRDFSLSNFSANLGSNLAAFEPQSPIGVLDAECWSSKSDESTVGSYTNSPSNSPNAKRHKSEGSSFHDEVSSHEI